MNTPQSQNINNENYYMNNEIKDNLDFKRYLSLFISNWYWFAAALFIALSIAYGINRWSEEVFTVSSTILIKDSQNSAVSNIFPGSESISNQQNVNNEIGILKSFNLNYRVMLRLRDFNIFYTSVGKRGIAESRMYKNTPFIVEYDTLTLEKQAKNKRVDIKILSETEFSLEINGTSNIGKKIKFGERFDEQGFDFIIKLREPFDYIFDPEASNRYYFYFTNPASLANQYRKKLRAAPVEMEASLVTLETTGSDRNQEADYLNTLMDVYRESGLDYKNETTDRSIIFIEEQLATISDSLQIAEVELENFRLKNRLISLSAKGTIIQNRVDEMDAERRSLILQKSYYEYLKDYIDSRNESGDIVAPYVSGIGDQVLIRMVDELSQLQRQKNRIAVSFDESAEPIKVMEENISSVRRSLVENVENGLNNIEISISNADDILSSIEQEISSLPSIEREMINIQRKYDVNNSVYTYLLEKRAEAGITRASNVPDNRIIDRAGFYSSSRIRPRERQNYMMAFILGLLIPLFLIITIDYLNNKIIDKSDIERGTNAPIVGFVSHNSLKSEIPVFENPRSTLSESFRSLRTNLKYFLKEKQCSVVSVSSTISSEGKTFVSANLAAIIALSGKKVLLVGLDLRKPRIHRIFGISNDEGISNYLIGEVEFERILVETEIENLWYAPSGPVPPNPAELIESEAMHDFIVKARKEFDFIIIDTPPVAIVTDALLVSSFSDIFLFIVRQRYSSRNTLELIEELRKNGNIRNLAIVVNDISISGYYGYGLRYGYGLGYGYNYGYNYYNQYGRYGYSNSAKGYYSDDDM